MKVLKIISKSLFWLFVILLGLFSLAFLCCVYLYRSADYMEPQISLSPDKAVVTDSLRTYKDDWLRRSETGLWEMKLSGGPIERGEAFGKMAGDLLYRQEEVFVDQLHRYVPDSSYFSFLHKATVIFDRRLGRNVPEEYRKEIKAMSEFCTHDFDVFGNPYERQLQYHSAHDIGHAMQDYMLVGCTSFGVWDGASKDSSLLIGRNFDFYVSDAFAENKIVMFFEPSEGHKFASVSWPGMIGVLSGMNDAGLTVCLLASKYEPPHSGTTPVSILAREILQYASTISEAYEIAESRKTFVCENILIGSSRDGRAAVIEKTPSHMDLYDVAQEEGLRKDRIVCTNHYQSESFRYKKANLENLRSSDSGFRFRRVEELLDSLGPAGPSEAAFILRDMKGPRGTDLGLCNDLSINQAIAHHSVIFQPGKLRMYVSTSPWQFGKYVCYDLAKVFSDSLDYHSEIYSDTLARDSAAFSAGLVGRILKYKAMTARIRADSAITESFLHEYEAVNPNYYGTYLNVGDYLLRHGSDPCPSWEKAINLQAKPSESEAIRQKLSKYKNKHRHGKAS